MRPGKKIIFSAAALLAFALLCLLYAYFVEPLRLVVNQYELRIESWNPAFDGFRVALISDIHAGSHGITADRLREIVEKTNVQDADAIFLLGDYVSQNREDGPIRTRSLRMPPQEIADNLAGLRAVHGVFVVLGNHDEWYGASAIAQEFERVGYNVLNGELAEINIIGGQKLRILGLRDHTTMGAWKDYSEDAKRIAVSTEGKGDLIVLQHSPDVFSAITGDLQISRDRMVMFAAHTHGGQIRLPVIGSPVVPSSYGQKFTGGHIKEGGMDIFVTTGIGTSIVPLRFLVPPEIAVVTIRAKIVETPRD